MKKKEDNNIAMVQAEPEPIGIEPSKTAIIVVDMQNAFVRKGGYYDLSGIDISPIENIIRPCMNILRAARTEGFKIIYLQMAYNPDLSDIGPQDSPGSYKSRGLKMMKTRPELKDKLYIEGSWGVDIIEELKPEPGDIIVRKQKYDGFIGTNLEIILRSLQIKYLVFIGVATNICVESTLRHAFFLDYFSILISDAVSQKGPYLTQEATFVNVKSNFGWVTTSEEFLKAI